MSPTATSLLAVSEAAVGALAAVSREVAAYRTLDDDTLLHLTRCAASQQKLAATNAALVAGEIARRSAREFGHSGLAQRSGYRTPEELVRATTGSTAREAFVSVRVGSLALSAGEGGACGLDGAGGPGGEGGADALGTSGGTPASFGGALPWLRDVGLAVVSGALSVAAAEAIRNGLGQPSANVTIEALAAAARQLCAEGGAAGGSAGAPEEGAPYAHNTDADDSGEPHIDDGAPFPTPALAPAPALDADRLYRRARDLRDELDEGGIADREATARAQRGLRYRRLPDGSAQISWTLDPESAAVCGELYNRATSPRRGGPRFVSPDAAAHAEAILRDPRTTAQLLSDVFLELLRHGAAANSSQLLGSGAPSISVLVTERSLRERAGHGRIEGQPAPISIETVERLVCTATTATITVDEHGQPLDVGREQRLYTRRQKVALAARDGGCRWPNCERPPSWTEAHHTQHWARDGGSTNVRDGILLCRHHHLLAHNNHWEVTRELGDYFLVPPPDIDPAQTPIPMPSTSLPMRELLRERDRQPEHSQQPEISLPPELSLSTELSRQPERADQFATL